MTLLIIGIVVFLGIHLLPTVPGLRDKLAARLGENGYKALFSLLSIAGFALLVWGFATAPVIQVWTPPAWTRWVAIALMMLGLYTMIAQRKGVIIHQGSGWGIQGGDLAVAYCAAKGGVVVMTKAMAIDHARQGIRVNCLCPGDVATPMLEVDAAARGLSWEEYMKGAEKRPMGRVGTPEELARAALFLASDDSSFMTGAALVVDGGGVAD